jgi:predicted DNA-binding protein
MKTKTKNGTSTPLYIKNIEPAERDRLDAFAEAVGRPVSWVVRDAVTCYLDSLEDDVAALREKLEAVTIELKNAGKTAVATRGRPPMSDKRP